MKYFKKSYLSASVIVLSLFLSVQSQGSEQLASYYFLAAKSGQTQVIEEFVNNGFPINLTNKMSYTALMMATYYGHTQTVERLLALGADTCLRDKRGNTAMMGAIIKAEWGIAKKLYSHDCKDSNTQQKTVEQFAAVFGKTKKLHDLANELQPTKTYKETTSN
jgi:ankyrin repeat protein